MLVGIDIGGTKTAVALAEHPDCILYRQEFPTLPDLGPEHALEQIQHLIQFGLSRHGRPSAFQLGVSCGGPLDRVRGIIQSPPNLPTWADVPIKDILESKFGASCQVDNDANAGAVAEHRYGAGEGCPNMIFLTMGTGFGAGLILNGALYGRGDKSRAPYRSGSDRLWQGGLGRRLGKRIGYGPARSRDPQGCTTRRRIQHSRGGRRAAPNHG